MICKPSFRHVILVLVILCLNNGRISEAKSVDEQATEVEDMCSQPPNRANSQINLTQEWLPIGTKVNYTCDPGYYLFGNDVRACQRHNTWSGDPIFCMKKVSVGMSVNCIGDQACKLLKNDGLEWLVDDNDQTCYPLPESIGGKHTFQWTIDLMEKFDQIGAFRFVFQSRSGTIPKVVIYLGSVPQQQIIVQPHECDVSQKQLEFYHSELIIRPKILKSAHFVHMFIDGVDPGQKTGFCAAEVFAEDAPAVHQCFEASSIDGTEESRSMMANSLTLGTSCYTFSRTKLDFATANTRCITNNDGRLAHGVTPEVKSMLTSFMKTKSLASYYWIAGKTQKKTVPGMKVPKVVWQWNNGEDIDRALWNPAGEPVERMCLGMYGPSGILDSQYCESYTESICQTGIKTCSSPEKDQGVNLTGTRNNTVGASITQSCPKGYILDGDHTRTCMPNGKWSGRAAMCNHKDSLKEKYEMEHGGMIAVIVSGIIVGLLIILIVVTIVIVKRRGSFKKTLHFKKHENGESVETLESKEDLKHKENVKHKESLTECPKENYLSVKNQDYELQVQQLE